MKNTYTLNLTFRLNQENFEATIQEPESGEVAQFNLPYDRDKIAEGLKNELFSWLSIWAEDEGIDFPKRW